MFFAVTAASDTTVSTETTVFMNETGDAEEATVGAVTLDGANLGGTVVTKTLGRRALNHANGVDSGFV